MISRYYKGFYLVKKNGQWTATSMLDDSLLMENGVVVKYHTLRWMKNYISRHVVTGSTSIITLNSNEARD